MKKSFVWALITGILFVAAYYAILIIQGMYLTMNKVPDVLEKYDSVSYLKSVTGISRVTTPLWSMIEVSGLMLLGIMVYYTVKRLRRKR